MHISLSLFVFVSITVFATRINLLYIIFTIYSATQYLQLSFVDIDCCIITLRTKYIETDWYRIHL